MKRRISAFLTALLLALSLCVPAMAETDYGLIYDETELLYSEDLATLGEHTLPELSEELGFEMRVDVLTGNSYESINAAAEGIYERFSYGYGSKSEGATLTVLMEPQDDGSYAIPERGGWCVYVSLSAERGSALYGRSLHVERRGYGHGLRSAFVGRERHGGSGGRLSR